MTFKPCASCRFSTGITPVFCSLGEDYTDGRGCSDHETNEEYSKRISQEALEEFEEFEAMEEFEAFEEARALAKNPLCDACKDELGGNPHRCHHCGAVLCEDCQDEGTCRMSHCRQIIQ